MCLESLLQAREVSCASYWEATHGTKVSRLIIERLARQCRMKKGTEKFMDRHTQRLIPSATVGIPPSCLEDGCQPLSPKTPGWKPPLAHCPAQSFLCWFPLPNFTEPWDREEGGQLAPVPGEAHSY